jgi:hypothetical protein
MREINFLPNIIEGSSTFNVDPNTSKIEGQILFAIKSTDKFTSPDLATMFPSASINPDGINGPMTTAVSGDNPDNISISSIKLDANLFGANADAVCGSLAETGTGNPLVLIGFALAGEVDK